MQNAQNVYDNFVHILCCKGVDKSGRIVYNCIVHKSGQQKQSLRGGVIMSTGEILRSLRGAKSISEVAKDVGVSNSAYIKYERGERVPRDEVKTRIAVYFNSSVERIFFASKSTNVN